MIPLRLVNKKWVSLFVNGQRRAMCMRSDFYIPPKKVLNVKRAERPVSYSCHVRQHHHCEGKGMTKPVVLFDTATFLNVRNPNLVLQGSYAIVQGVFDHPTIGGNPPFIRTSYIIRRKGPISTALDSRPCTPSIRAENNDVMVSSVSRSGNFQPQPGCVQMILPDRETMMYLASR